MSQTRRRGTQILQDEIDSAIALVKTHNTNITRKLEKVKDMVSRYCENKGTAPAPAPVAFPNTSNSLREAAPAPTATALSPIPEGNESNSSPSPVVAPSNSLAASASVPVSLKSKGPKPWSNFRTLVGKNTQLKVGQTATSQKIASLWEQAKKGSSTNEIAKFLKNQLQVEPGLANQKAPELAKIAVNYAKPTLSKRVTRTVGSNGSVGGAGSAAAAAASSSQGAAARVTQKKNKVPLAGAPINPNTESDEQFWSRMGQQANANAARKNATALQQAENRRLSRTEAALRATPLKNRQVPLAAQANTNVNRSAPIPTLVRNPTVVNPTTGEEEQLSL
jgi:hypothetical protein